MQRVAVITVMAAALALSSARAERRLAPPRPYEPVAVRLAEPLDDKGFAAFRDDLAAVAGRRIYAELAERVVAHGFFWGRDFAGRLDQRRPGVDNLAAALRLEHADGAGWRMLARLAADGGAQPLESRPGVVCAPTPAAFDGIAFHRLLRATRTDAFEWMHPLADGTVLRAAPKDDAAVVATLGLHLVRVLAPASRAQPADWVRAVAPDGRVGFAAPGALRALEPARLCYGRNATGRWQIVGFIAAGR